MSPALEPSPVVVDGTTPRSLDAPVIKEHAIGTMVVAGAWSVLAIGIASIPVLFFDWVTFGFCVAADIGLFALVTRIVVAAYRTRRVWRRGAPMDVKVRASSLAWKGYNGGAYTIELELPVGSTLTFDYAQGQPVGASFPALVHDGWILVLFSTNATALKRLPEFSPA